MTVVGLTFIKQSFCLFLFVWRYWGLNPELPACKAANCSTTKSYMLSIPSPFYILNYYVRLKLLGLVLNLHSCNFAEYWN